LSSPHVDAALRAPLSVRRLDANLLHPCQVDHQAAIDGGTSRHVVATSADRHFETEPLREPDSIGHVGCVSALRDQCRAFVHEPVVDLSRFLVVGVTRLQKLAAEGVAKLCRRSGNRSDCRHDTRVPSLCPIASSTATGEEANAKNSVEDENHSSTLGPMNRLPPLIELRAFEAAARHVSFKKAAAELGVTPTAISHQIRLLEQYCGRACSGAGRDRSR
jgi:hypothetical protein